MHFGVSGRVPLGDRPGVAALLEKSKRCKTMTWLFEDETRVARSVKAHIASKEWAKQNGIKVVHAGLPDLWASEEPTQEFLDLVLAGQSELVAKVKYQTLRGGREVARRTSTRRTIAGKRKVEGRKRMSEIYPLLATLLSDFLQKPYYKQTGTDGQKKTLPDIARYLKRKGVVTKARYTINTKGKKVMVTKPGQALHKGSISKLLRNM